MRNVRGVQTPKVTVMRGGLDLVTPAMMIQPGFAIAAQNYEAEARGYSRMHGYERYDGRARPSEPDYLVLAFTGGSVEVLEGETVTGLTSGATGVALYDGDLTGGTYGGSNAVGSLVLYSVTGTFQDNEDLQVSASTVALADGAGSLNGASSDTLDAQYVAAITALNRAAIQKPVGSGPVRGVATYGGNTYCWRDNVGGTAGQMFKATSAGWVLQSFGWTLPFSAGSPSHSEFFEGETLTGTTSGATATIERIVLQSGAYAVDGIGYMVLSNLTGSFNASEDITSASGKADTTSSEIPETLSPGGRYRSEVFNFYGTESFERLYFVNGVDVAHEWDGSVLAPIYTGLPANKDKPQHIGVHKNHLFLSVSGGSIQHSGTGTPLSFTAVGGAGEIGFGQEITGIKSEYRDSLIITARNKLGYLVGTSSANFELKTISLDSGAIENTLEIVGKPIFLDDQGLRDLMSSDQYGDWNMGTISLLVEPIFENKRQTGMTPVGAFRVRSKDQYRIFWSDGSGLVIYFGRQDPEILPLELGFVPYSMYSGESAGGNEILFATDQDGWVLQLDRGTSFDGEEFTSFLRLAYDHQQMPNFEKRYHRARVEGEAIGSFATVGVTAEYSYGAPDRIPSPQSDLVLQGQGGSWNEVNWNEFQWSAASQTQAFADLGGLGENVSFAFFTDSATEEPHTFSTITTYYTKRRMIR